MASLERPTGACVGELTATKSVGGITALHYGTHSTAKHLLAAACDGGSVFVWDTEQRAVQAQFVGASFFPTIVVLETSLTVTGPQSRLFARDMGLTRFGATTSASQLKKKNDSVPRAASRWTRPARDPTSPAATAVGRGSGWRRQSAPLTL